MSEYTPTTEEVRAEFVTNKSLRMPTTWRGAEEFDRWLAAHDAEVRREQADFDAERINDLDTRLVAAEREIAEVRAGVVAEEPEWEYGTEYDIDAHESVFMATHSEEMARKWVADSPHDTGLVRRRKAGPWTPVPVEQGDDDA